jgi:hypothetical protein
LQHGIVGTSSVANPFAPEFTRLSVVL